MDLTNKYELDATAALLAAKYPMETNIIADWALSFTRRGEVQRYEEREDGVPMRQVESSYRLHAFLQRRPKDTGGLHPSSVGHVPPAPLWLVSRGHAAVRPSTRCEDPRPQYPSIHHSRSRTSRSRRPCILPIIVLPSRSESGQDVPNMPVVVRRHEGFRRLLFHRAGSDVPRSCHCTGQSHLEVS